ncbi:MAG TPA: PEGA domain-containing protein [Polyangiaceae bacterium]|nr:PEGA domain-containing protein [Polyangiaceae bacterium]
MARVAPRLAIVAALAVALAPRPSAASDVDNEQAEESFREGNRAFAAGDYHAAFAAYRAAWSLKQTFDIACNLGRTEVELSLSRDAAEHLDYCLRTFSVSSRGEVRDANKRFRELFARVRHEVAALSVEVRPAGAEVTVDGASYGLAPLGRDIFLDPGPHRVRARLSGFHDDERSVTAEAAGSLSVSLALTPLPAPSPAAVAATPAERAAAPSAVAHPEANGIEPRTIVVLAGTGLSLVALGIGLGFTLDANSTHERAQAVSDEVRANQGGCQAASTPDCQSLASLVDHTQKSRDVADIALGTGAALGAATLAAWLLIPDAASNPTSGSLRALPSVGRGFAGVSFTGAY